MEKVKINPKPSLEDMKKGLARNPCRCTGYVKIFEAVMLASQCLTCSTQKGMVQPGKDVVGKNVPMLDAQERATGLAKYGDDLFFPEMLHGKVVRSPHAHAEITRIDAEDALAMPGVCNPASRPSSGFSIFLMAYSNASLYKKTVGSFRIDLLSGPIGFTTGWT